MRRSLPLPPAGGDEDKIGSGEFTDEAAVEDPIEDEFGRSRFAMTEDSSPPTQTVELHLRRPLMPAEWVINLDHGPRFYRLLNYNYIALDDSPYSHLVHHSFAAGFDGGVSWSSANARTSSLNQRSRGSQVMTERLYGKSNHCPRHVNEPSGNRNGGENKMLTVSTFIPTSAERCITAVLTCFGSPMERSVRGSERKRKWWIAAIHAFADERSTGAHAQISRKWKVGESKGSAF